MRLKSLVLCSTSIPMLALAAATPAFAQDQTQTGPVPGEPTIQAPAQTPDPSSQGPATTRDAGTQQPTEQASSEEPAESIVVTGIRRSLQSSQNIRRNSLQIVDSVVAEDIGKLPDLNTAETAARIPGIQVYRQGGEAQNVLVRGLPNFTTTYNGREIFTAETRVVALQDFPSANIAALEVYKTSSADLVEPGLAGLVNVRSRMPFDFTDGQIAGSVWGLYTRQGRGLKPNFNFLVTKRWDTGAGEIGVLLNASYEQMRYRDAEISNTDYINTFGIDAAGHQVSVDPATAPAGGQIIRLPDVQRLYYRSGRRERPSINGALQWRPSPDVTLYAEGLWQGFRNQVDDTRLDLPLHDFASIGNLQFRDGTNIVSSGSVVGQPGSIFSFAGATFNKTDTYQFAGGAKINHDNWKVNIDVARTTSTFKGSTESLDRVWTNGYTADFNLEKPEFGISGIDFRDPGMQTFQGLYEENQRSRGRDWQARADVEYDFDNSFLKNIQFGARYTHRRSIRNFGSRYGFILPAGINLADLPVDFDVFHGVSFQPTYEWAVPSYGSVRDNIVDLRQLIIDNCAGGCGFTTAPPVDTLQWTGREHTLAGYAQANLGNDDLNGTVGVRVLKTNTKVAGPVPTGIPALDQPNKKTVWLPNASIRYRITPEIQLRASASKTETRPDFGQLVPSITFNGPPASGIGTESDPWTANGGNPFLKPFTSWNYDAAIEYYFGRTSFVSLTGFHHDVDGFIQTNTYRFTDTTHGVVQVTAPANTGKGKITGVEAQGQVFFDYDWLPDWARGFGAQANVTYIKAKTQQPNGTSTNGIPNLSYFPITDQLNGVSKWNYNLVGIYERYGFSARLSYNGRSKFEASRQYRGNDVYTETAHPAGRLDLSLNYDVGTHFTLFGDWTNITNSKFHQDFTSARSVAGVTPPVAEYPRYTRYDETTVSAGFRFRF